MLRIKNAELRLVSHGYHFDNHGKKYVRVFMSLDFIVIKVRIEKHKEMHISSMSVWFPYTITDDWVEMTAPLADIDGCGTHDYIDRRCKEIWFV